MSRAMKGDIKELANDISACQSKMELEKFKKLSIAIKKLEACRIYGQMCDTFDMDEIETCRRDYNKALAEVKELEKDIDTNNIGDAIIRNLILCRDKYENYHIRLPTDYDEALFDNDGYIVECTTAGRQFLMVMSRLICNPNRLLSPRNFFSVEKHGVRLM